MTLLRISLRSENESHTKHTASGCDQGYLRIQWNYIGEKNIRVTFSLNGLPNLRCGIKQKLFQQD